MTAITHDLGRAVLRPDSEDALGSSFRREGLGEFEARSDYAACLMPLLEALGWNGTRRELSEALPHYANNLNQESFRNVLATLGFRTIARNVRAGERLDPRLFPCLFIARDGRVSILLGGEGDIIGVFDGQKRQWLTSDGEMPAGKALLLTRLDPADETGDARTTWLASILHRFRGTIVRLLALTLLLNVLSLVVPLFIMAIYDQVIPAASDRVLVPLAIGLLLAFVIESSIRILRSRMIAFLGGRLEFVIARSVFRRILAMPLSLTESAPLSSQIARIREFDSLRDVFAGTLVAVFLEFPFVLIFLAVIASLGGWIAAIPLVMMGVFATVGVVIVPILRRAVARSSNARSDRHRMLVEFITNLRSIREAGASLIWQQRHRELSATACLAQFQTGQISFLVQSLAQTIMMAAGAATIIVGVLLVMQSDMTTGGLIAVMALVWRVLSPINNLFLTLTRAEQIKMATDQVNQLMTMPVEERQRHSGGIRRKWAGGITFNRVSFRYRPTSDPALLGIAFSIKPGEMLAVIGPNGSGKSSILRLILGLYQPQAGQVSIDGLDVRQIDPAELRQEIAYVPQQVHMFHGTLAQNLRLSNPTASNEDIETACRKAALWDDIQDLPRGLETRFGDQSIWQLNAGFRQRLSLARAYLRNASIILLDEPAQALDNDGDAALVEALQDLKGKSTIVMVSHRPSHIRLADNVLVLNAGAQSIFGEPEAVMKQLPGGVL